MKGLGVLSALQLLVHPIGARQSLRDKIPYDLPFAQGEPENVSRDMWTMGSGMAAPWPTLAAHAAGTVFAFGKPRRWPTRLLAWIGVVYVFGYLGERGVRESFQRPNEYTVLNGIALALAAAMVVRGFTLRR